jgi:hypothetical protein
LKKLALIAVSLLMGCAQSPGEAACQKIAILVAESSVRVHQLGILRVPRILVAVLAEISHRSGNFSAPQTPGIDIDPHFTTPNRS